MPAEPAPQPAAPVNPYVGPRSFKLHEAYFYGRDREARELVNLITAERVVLLHSPSGAGKTSLIQAALIPALEATFEVLPVVRVGRDVASAGAAPVNRYALSAVLSLHGSQAADPQRLAAPDLAADLDALAASADAAEAKPQLVIFDQFEELLTVAANDRAAKHAFIAQVGAALRRPPAARRGGPPPRAPRWALFAMRNEYAAEMLATYLRLLPDAVGGVYPLYPLDGEQALEAIRRPAAEKEVTFTAAAAERLVRNLSAAQGSASPAATADQPPLKDLAVEPVQLQVVCYRLWEELWARGALTTESRTVEEWHVEQYADVDNALSGYFADKVGEAVRSALQAEADPAADRAPALERDVRAWFEQRLITRDGDRAIVQEGQDRDADIPPAAVKALVDAYLVRRDEKGGRAWLELSHGRLIEPIRRSNERWFAEHLQPWQLQAAQWERQDRAEPSLLRGAALSDAEQWQAGQPGRVSRTDRAFLEASLNRATTQERVMGYVFRWWAYLGTGACILLVALVVAFWRQSEIASANAERFHQEAERNRQLLLLTAIARQSVSRQQVGAAKALGTSDATRQKHRPIQPGLSIGGALPEKGPAPAGVITALVTDRGGFIQREPKTYLLTAPEALAPAPPPPPGLKVYQPSWLDLRDGADLNEVARVARDRAYRVVRADGTSRTVAVLAELLPTLSWDPHVYAFGAVREIGEVRPGEKVLLVGRSSILKEGKVASRGPVALFDQGREAVEEFPDLLEIRSWTANPHTAIAFSQPGDAGAPILTPDGRLVGMTLTQRVGNKSGHATYAVPIAPVLEALNVELLTRPRPAPRGR